MKDDAKDPGPLPRAAAPPKPMATPRARPDEEQACRFCTAIAGQPTAYTPDPKGAHKCAACRTEPVNPKADHYSRSPKAMKAIVRSVSPRP